jgi:hypothetical protein
MRRRAMAAFIGACMEILRGDVGYLKLGRLAPTSVQPLKRVDQVADTTPRPVPLL